MTAKARIRVAATVTAMFLAGISAAGLAVHTDGKAKVTTPSTAHQRAAPPGTAAVAPLVPLDEQGYSDELDEEGESGE